MVFFLDDEDSNDIHEFERNLPDEFAFRVCPKFKNEEVDIRFFETDDKQLITSIEPQDYEIGKIRSVLTTFLAEELEYLTDTFALEANDELTYNRDYAKEGNELYQIIT